jgi:hypothetical protein
MELHTLLLIQAVTDVVLGAAVVLLLVRLERRRPHRPAVPDDVRQLKESLQESEAYSRRFLADLEAARQALEDTIRRAEKTREALRAAATTINKSETPDGRDYGSVAAMIGAGLTEREIAARSGLPEGEIKLISDLLRTKHERT